MSDPRRHEGAHGPDTVDPDPDRDAVTHGETDGDWEFDASVAEVFDDMLERSIPQYGLMRETVADVASDFFQSGTSIVDLGASRGGAIAPLIRKHGAHARYYDLVETSDPMLDVLRERFSGWQDTPNGDRVRIHDHDLRDGLPDEVTGSGASVVLCVLTMQFIPVNYRQQLMAQIYNSLNRGGALVMVEKVLGEGARLDDLMVDRYHRMKRERGGYSEEEVRRKAMALEGELVPMTAEFNRELMSRAGFRPVDTFWRWMNFAGWVAVKR